MNDSLLSPETEDPRDVKLVGSDRVLAVLSELSRHPDGVSLDEMARLIAGSKPTVHRALASLRRAGFAQQDSRGHYVLGDEFVRMAFAHHEARPEHLRVQPILEQLAERHGETAHYAVLDGAEIVYRAKVDPPRGAMKLTSTVGGRNPAHTTAVGKLLLANRLTTLDAVRGWVGGRTLTRPTDRSLATAEELHDRLVAIRELGYSVDDQENEPGVNCLAVPVHLSSERAPSGGISISALAHRLPLAELVGRIDEIRAVVAPVRSVS